MTGCGSAGCRAASTVEHVGFRMCEAHKVELITELWRERAGFDSDDWAVSRLSRMDRVAPTSVHMQVQGLSSAYAQQPDSGCGGEPGVCLHGEDL